MFVILDVVWGKYLVRNSLKLISVVMQIAGQYFVAGAKSAEITDDDPMFATGVSTRHGSVDRHLTGRLPA